MVQGKARALQIDEGIMPGHRSAQNFAIMSIFQQG
jgi:hypothetical protein